MLSSLFGAHNRIGRGPMSRDVCFSTATELAHRILTREISVTEVVQAHLAQIERVNPKVNAIVTLTAEQALADARAKDAAFARGETPGPLFGLPVAHKDLVPTRGIRTTFGSPIYRDHVPDQDALLVERLRAAGAVTVGKTNTPEFGAGSQTFNEVFGRTLNPYDLTKTCGGSSGGAAVALACGLVPLAGGSDTGGSLRNPASFCNVVGLRGAVGRVPPWPTDNAWAFLHVPGPMARTVADAALMLSVLAGPDRRSPIAIAESGDRFRAPLGRDFKSVRIAWSRDLGGLPIDRRVTKTLDAQRATFETLGCVVEDGEPDFADARHVFQVQRALAFATRYGPLLERHRHQIKDTVIWNVEEGLKLTAKEIGEADVQRTRLYHRVREVMERHEFLLLPAVQVPPFDVTQPYITEINGVRLPTYIDWMRVCSDITVTGLPAISVPAGFTDDGLPIGELLQRGRPPGRRRARAAMADGQRVGVPARARAHGAYGGRRGADAERAGRARPAIADRHRRVRRSVPRSARPRLQGRAHRLEPRPRRAADRPARSAS